MTASWFQRYLLPGFAFKAVVIGGGYATGRELVEFFLPTGPRGGLLAMLFAAVIWSVVCIVTFLFARATHSEDYRTFFRHLLGRGWIAFEIAYCLFIVLILAVFGAAAGAIGASLLGWPPLVGTLCLMLGIALFVAFGNASVEELFKWVSFFLYGVYALFVILALGKFGDRISANLALEVPTDGWLLAGVTYAGYNIVGAVIILPVLRHLTSNRDAIIAGALAGPLAMIPAVLFFVCMIAYYPEVGTQALPSDFLLQKLDAPLFHAVFQFMIFAALLESGTGSVHAVNQRIAQVWQARSGRDLSARARFIAAGILLVVAMLLADRFGLVTLIARGYRGLAYMLIAVYVLPVLTYGVWLLWQRRAQPALAPVSPAQQ
ncbi:MAG: hypothetical protein SXG53_03615 [Pseudomonadota bacterium]|nr:hypothetical protein [Pseudomonadota bacterium]